MEVRIPSMAITQIDILADLLLELWLSHVAYGKAQAHEIRPKISMMMFHCMILQFTSPFLGCFFSTLIQKCDLKCMLALGFQIVVGQGNILNFLSPRHTKPLLKKFNIFPYQGNLKPFEKFYCVCFRFYFYLTLLYFCCSNLPSN